MSVEDDRNTVSRRGLPVLVLANLVAIVGIASACRKDGDRREETLRLGYFPNLTHAQAVLGVSSGEMAEAVRPRRLDTKIFSAGPSLTEALFAGEIDIGYVGPGPALNAHSKSKGRGIRVIAGGAANGVIIVARPESSIRSMADLAGKKIATPQLGNTQDLSARHYLMSVLKQTDTRNVVPVPNAEQAGMLARGDVDAAWVPEPWGQRLVLETGARIIAEEKDLPELWPTQELAVSVVVTTPEFGEKHPDVVDRVIAVHRSWTKRLTEAPAVHEAALGDALAKLSGKRLPDGALRPALSRVKFIDEPPEVTLRTYAAWTHELGFDRSVVNLAGLVDRSALRRTAP